VVKAFDFDAIELFNQVGEQIVILYWEVAAETAAQHFKVAIGQESERNDAFGDHDAYLLLQ
jgi:hypothetical protein